MRARRRCYDLLLRSLSPHVVYFFSLQDQSWLRDLLELLELELRTEQQMETLLVET